MSNIPSRRILLATLVLFAATPGFAQNSSAPQTLPGLENFSLPPSRPTVTPTPTPIQTPVPTPTATAPVVAPTVTPTPVPRATPGRTRGEPPTAAPTATPAPTPVDRATPVATPTPDAIAPTPRATPSPTAVAAPATPPAAGSTPASRDGGSWLLPIGIGAVLGGLVVFLALRRRRPAAEPVGRRTARPAAAASAAISDAPMPPPAAPASRAHLTIALRPTRAGLNVITATVEGEITVTNDGDAPADAIRVGLMLIAAGAKQDVALAEVYSRPIGRPLTPPFALAPGESRTMRAVAALSRDAIEPMVAGGRPMFVPLAAATCLYETAGERAQTSQAFVVGVERVDSAKLAPFWLDLPPKSHDQVAARAQGPVVKR